MKRNRNVGLDSRAVQLLFVGRGFDMTITTDQALIKRFTGVLWMPTHVVAKRVSGAFGTACAGGVYTAASKGGNAIVANSQSYAALTGANTIVNATLAAIAGAAAETSAAAYFALTTGNTGALTADIFIYGVIID